MKADLRKLLEAKREQHVVQTAQALLAGGEASKIKPKLDEIDAYSKLLSETQSKSDHNLKWAVAVGILCLVMAGGLWHLELPRTDVSMTLATDSLRATLLKPCVIDDAFYSHRVHIEHLSAIHAPNLGLAIDHGQEDAWLELEGGQVALKSLVLNGIASVELETTRDEVELYVSQAPLTGTLTVTGKVSVTAGPRTGETSSRGLHQLDVPETVEFSVERSRSVPLRFVAYGPNPWSLADLQVSDLSFARERSWGAAEKSLASGVKRGIIRFNDTSWPTLELREGDFLALRPTRLAKIHAWSEDGLIHLTLNGAVVSVAVGGPGATKKLTPSYLEYLYSKKSLALFWGATVFLWGLIWSVRNTIFR